MNGHFAQSLVGQDAAATEKHWDVMRRSSAPYGSAGLASYAISAVDIALWDLKGKLLGRPVYELLGGPQKESIPCYASNTDLSYGTENSVAWFLELGFKAVKLFLREGPEAGIEGIRRSEELVARTREQIGPDVELMVDAWISLNVETTVRLGEALRPYRIKWLEDYLLPEDLEGYTRVRQRLPGTTLATGEHWYGPPPVRARGRARAGRHPPARPRLVGGMSAGGADLPPGRGARADRNRPRWHELPVRAAPVAGDAGHPDGRALRGRLAAGRPARGDGRAAGHGGDQKGRVRPTDAPGFGFEISKDWLESRNRLGSVANTPHPIRAVEGFTVVESAFPPLA